MSEILALETAFQRVIREQHDLIAECLMDAAQEALKKAPDPKAIDWLYPQYGKWEKLPAAA